MKYSSQNNGFGKSEGHNSCQKLISGVLNKHWGGGVGQNRKKVSGGEGGLFGTQQSFAYTMFLEAKMMIN